MPRVTFLLALPAIACDVGGGADLAPDFENELTHPGGCGDLYVFAVDTADEMIMELRFDGPIEAAAGANSDTTYTLPDAAVDLTVNVGSTVSDASCDDVIENGGPDIKDTWTVVSGSVNLRIEFEGDDTPLADVVLTDAVFESDNGDQVTVETFEWTNVSVGWFAG